MDAFNEIDLELRLKRMGLDLISFREGGYRRALHAESRVQLPDLIMFCFQMEQLIRAGVPMLESLADLRDSTEHPGFKETIGQLISEVEGGLMLSHAMALHPKVFGQVFVSLVRAGEQTGRLPEVFENLATTLKWQHELISQTKRLLIYPLFVLVVVLGAAAFLMTYLVPQMAGFLKNMGQELPIQTRVMIAISDAMITNWWLFAIIPILIIMGIIYALKKSERLRYRYDYWLLQLPVTGEVFHKIIMARFTRYFSLMYKAGIPILDAIRNCQDIVGNKAISDGLERAYQQISSGESMSESFHNLGLFPPLVIRMLRVGESTGALDVSLLNVSYFYDRDVKDAVDRMLKLLEPTLTVILGLVLAAIMFSVLGPVYDSLSKMKI